MKKKIAQSGHYNHQIDAEVNKYCHSSRNCVFSYRSTETSNLFSAKLPPQVRLDRIGADLRSLVSMQRQKLLKCPLTFNVSVARDQYIEYYYIGFIFYYYILLFIILEKSIRFFQYNKEKRINIWRTIVFKSIQENFRARSLQWIIYQLEFFFFNRSSWVRNQSLVNWSNTFV